MFERLTSWDKESAYIRQCFEKSKYGCKNMCSNKCHTCEDDYAVCKRLAEYEDSGLAPEEITEAKELERAWAEGRLIMLPVPIGETIYIPYKCRDLDGTVMAGVEEAKLSGYIKEGDGEFFTTFDESGTSDYEPGTFYLTKEEAEKALETLEIEECEQKCRVCGCTWDHACEGGCYWVEYDLCSQCAAKEAGTEEDSVIPVEQDLDPEADCFGCEIHNPD